MRAPAFTAEAALYDSKYHYAGKGGTLGGAKLSPQIIVQPRPFPFITCDVAQALCIQNAHGTGFDPSGWCDWYHANCITGGPPNGGGGSADGGSPPGRGPKHQ
jgi:hypothetical protein